MTDDFFGVGEFGLPFISICNHEVAARVERAHQKIIQSMLINAMREQAMIQAVSDAIDRIFYVPLLHPQVLKNPGFSAGYVPFGVFRYVGNAG